MFRPPRKAFVLAAGLGTRLRPLTLETPKPMLPLWGKPMLARTLETLASWGVRDVLVNLHHAPGPILRHLASCPVPGLRAAAVFEPAILGTGGALRNASWFLDEPFWLLNADVVADLDPSPLLSNWRSVKPLAACWLTENAGPKTVRCENGLVRDFNDPSRGHATFCGLHLLDRRILDFVAPSGFDSIVDAYRRAQARGHSVSAVFVPNSFWADVGTPSQYVQAHRDVARRLGHVDSTFSLPAAAVLSPREQTLLRRIRPRIPSSAPNIPFIPVDVLPPRGSAREFFRLRDGNRSSILVRWSPDRPDNRLYARHARFLASLGIPVPAVEMDSPNDRFLAIEDLGADTLESRLPRMAPAERLRVYRRLLETTLSLHLLGLPAARRSRIPLMPAFDDSLFAWEHAYFLDNAPLSLIRAPESARAAAALELLSVARRLDASPKTLVHRDWQSSNVLFRGPVPVMIDFQGMRPGPAAYDLASLLCDPYADLPAPLRHNLLRFYCRRHPQGKAIASAFPAAAVQRLCQAIGAYSVLSRKPGMERFARYTPPAARLLLASIDAFGPLPALRSFALSLADSNP